MNRPAGHCAVVRRVSPPLPLVAGVVFQLFIPRFMGDVLIVSRMQIWAKQF